MSDEKMVKVPNRFATRQQDKNAEAITYGVDLKYDQTQIKEMGAGHAEEDAVNEELVPTHREACAMTTAFVKHTISRLQPGTHRQETEFTLLCARTG